MKLALVAGARPNFMKIAPILHALADVSEIEAKLIHTGQHYDKNLSDIFFDQLEIKRPDISLGADGGTHAEQTSKIMIGIEQVLTEAKKIAAPFDRLVVVGDVNSTMAASIAAAKLHVPVAHIEAGLRSFDRRMPEEINRIVTDSIADQLFVSEPSGVQNLQREGVAVDRIHLVGNVMIDTLKRLLPAARETGTLQQYDLTAQEYGVITLHRPSNVDREETLRPILEVLVEASKDTPFVFPVHPRTAESIERFGLSDLLQQADGIRILPPVGYLEFLCLTSSCRVIVTDSGGIQEESTVLGIPCLTMRRNTERPVTVSDGSSTLIGNDLDLLASRLADVHKSKYNVGSCPDLWDGKAAERIVDVWSRDSLAK